MSPFEALREGKPDCPSSFTLDRLQARELDQATLAPLQLHIGQCATCSERMRARGLGFDALNFDSRPMLAAIRRGAETPSRSRFYLGGLALFATLTLVVFVSLGRSTDGVRTKGGLSLRLFRLVGDHSQEVTSSDTFATGDRLRFVVDLPRAGFIQVLGVEASGKVFTAWPTNASDDTHREVGTAVALPGAVELDATAGNQRLVLVECDSAAQLAECLGPPGGVHCPAACAQTTFLVKKQ